MTSILSIPEDLRPGFDDIVEMDETKFNLLLDYIQNVPVGTTSNGLNSGLTELFNDVSQENISKTLYSLTELLSDLDYKFVAEELSSIYDEDKAIQKLLFDRLIKLFSQYKNLNITSKAIKLLYENERLFQECRIISDVRLVFNDEIENSNRWAVIIHNLKVDYISNSTKKEIFFSLDSNDLKILRKHIDRAIAKEGEILKSHQEQINFIDINL